MGHPAANDAERIEKFLALVREHSQWHDNWSVLAPGDVTPYLRTTITAALGTLALGLPEGKLIRFCALVRPQGGVSMDSWLVFEHEGNLFDIEGKTSEAKIERRLREQLENQGLKGKKIDIVASAPPNIQALFSAANGQGLKSIHMAQGAWAEAFEADKLQASTPPARAGKPRRF